MNIDLVVYHKNCNDGFAAAFVVWYWFKKNHPDKLNQIEFLPRGYEEGPLQVTGRNILVVDFSFPYKETMTLIENNKSFFVIDHHDTAREALEKLDDKFKIFDMKECGASLTWNFFFPDTPLPFVLDLVKDRDLWQKKFKASDPFSKVLFAMVIAKENIFKDFETFQSWLEDPVKSNSIIDMGCSWTEYDQVMIKDMKKHFKVKLYDGHFIAYLNTNVIKSDIGNAILQDPLIEVAAIYHFDEWAQKTVFSLRSKGVHVGKIARLFGGGGHEKASSCSLDGLHCELPGTREIGKLWGMMKKIEVDEFAWIPFRLEEMEKECQGVVEVLRRFGKPLVFYSG